MNKPLLLKAPYKPNKKHVLPALLQSAPTETSLGSGPYAPAPPNIHSFPGNFRHTLAFPPIQGAPLTPAEALEQYSDLLTKKEAEEIVQFPQIYWIRKELRSDNAYTQKRPQTQLNFFPFEKDGHIIYRFQQLAVIGCGAYGIAIRCYDHKTKKQYILKIIRDNEIIHPQVEMELTSLRTILTKDPNPSRIVHLYEDFTYRNYQFFVFEILGSDIYSTLKSDGFVGFDKNKLQIIFRQVSEALAFTHSIGIIHCDLKPENILWTDSRKLGIKLIDFGCSCFSGHTMFKYIQSRYYRAPEVILGIPYNQAIDVWSLGCMMAELATGEVLFPGHNEEEQLLYFISVLGLPPSQMLAKASKRKQFFGDNNLPLAYSRDEANQKQPNNPKITLTNLNCMENASNLIDNSNLAFNNSKGTFAPIYSQKTLDNHYFGLPVEENSQLITDGAQTNQNSEPKKGSSSNKTNQKWELQPPMGLMRKLKINDTIFISLLQQCLKWNPDERIRAKDILRHPWLKQLVPKL